MKVGAMVGMLTAYPSEKWVRRFVERETMLNDTQCRTAKPKDRPYKLSDDKGLYLEVKPNGTKAWRYRFKLEKDGKLKESVFAIGTRAIQPRLKMPLERSMRSVAKRVSGRQASISKAWCS